MNKGSTQKRDINRPATIDIIGLLGFTMSGVLFVLSALRSGDGIALAGSVVWIVSCVGWIGALISRDRNGDR